MRNKNKRRDLPNKISLAIWHVKYQNNAKWTLNWQNNCVLHVAHIERDFRLESVAYINNFRLKRVYVLKVIILCFRQAILESVEGASMFSPTQTTSNYVKTMPHFQDSITSSTKISVAILTPMTQIPIQAAFVQTIIATPNICNRR